MKILAHIAALICVAIPASRLKNMLLRILGWRIGREVRIGFSYVYCSSVQLGPGSRIGHGNFVRLPSIRLAASAYLGHANVLDGPFFLRLDEFAGIGNQNRVARARKGVVWGRSMLRLGKWSKITVGHFVDCTRSVRMRDFSTLAGRGSQVWTHGYLHAASGIDRFRIDGRVQIGSNVYVGSGCMVNAGVYVCDGVTIGSATCISRSISEPGLYVSQPLRQVSMNYGEALARHPRVTIHGLVDTVVNKHCGPNA